MVSTGDANPEDREVRIFQFNDLTVDDEDSATLTLNDIASGGSDIEVDLMNASDHQDGWEGTETINGKTHTFWYNSSRSLLWVEMNEGVNSQEEGYLPLASGTVMILNPNGSNAYETYPGWNLSLHVPADLQDDAAAAKVFNVTLEASSGEVRSSGPTWSEDDSNPMFSEEASTNDNEVSEWYSEYGVLVRLDETSDEDEFTFHIPYSQLLPQVFGVSGEVTSTVVEDAGSAVTVSPVEAGIAVLDSEVGTNWRNTNTIAVGGPCVNSVAADLMGNPTDCTEGFTEGRAMVRLFEQSGDNVAMLVAGYNADDTRRASTVVNRYNSYGDRFSGMEVEVSGTTMSDITVTSVQ